MSETLQRIDDLPISESAVYSRARRRGYALHRNKSRPGYYILSNSYNNCVLIEYATLEGAGRFMDEEDGWHVV